MDSDGSASNRNSPSRPAKSTVRVSIPIQVALTVLVFFIAFMVGNVLPVPTRNQNLRRPLRDAPNQPPIPFAPMAFHLTRLDICWEPEYLNEILNPKEPVSVRKVVKQMGSLFIFNKNLPPEKIKQKRIVAQRKSRELLLKLVEDDRLLFNDDKLAAVIATIFLNELAVSDWDHNIAHYYLAHMLNLKAISSRNGLLNEVLKAIKTAGHGTEANYLIILMLNSDHLIRRLGRFLSISNDGFSSEKSLLLNNVYENFHDALPVVNSESRYILNVLTGYFTLAILGTTFAKFFIQEIMYPSYAEKKYPGTNQTSTLKSDRKKRTTVERVIVQHDKGPTDYSSLANGISKKNSVAVSQKGDSTNKHDVKIDIGHLEASKSAEPPQIVIEKKAVLEWNGIKFYEEDFAPYLDDSDKGLQKVVDFFRKNIDAIPAKQRTTKNAIISFLDAKWWEEVNTGEFVEVKVEQPVLLQQHAVPQAPPVHRSEPEAVLEAQVEPRKTENTYQLFQYRSTRKGNRVGYMDEASAVIVEALLEKIRGLGETIFAHATDFKTKSFLLKIEEKGDKFIVEESKKSLLREISRLNIVDTIYRLHEALKQLKTLAPSIADGVCEVASIGIVRNGLRHFIRHEIEFDFLFNEKLLETAEYLGELRDLKVKTHKSEHQYTFSLALPSSGTIRLSDHQYKAGGSLYDDYAARFVKGRDLHAQYNIPLERTPTWMRQKEATSEDKARIKDELLVSKKWMDLFRSILLNEKDFQLNDTERDQLLVATGVQIGLIAELIKVADPHGKDVKSWQKLANEYAHNNSKLSEDQVEGIFREYDNKIVRLIDKLTTLTSQRMAMY